MTDICPPPLVLHETRLSVNVNKVAVLRNSRGGCLPSPLRAAQVAVEAGAQGITVHPRPDQRHIRTADVTEIARWLSLQPSIEFNIEGNPFAPSSKAYPGLLAMAEAARPEQVTLVPDSDDQITSDHGWNLALHAERLAPMIERLHQTGARVSLFVDSDCAALELAKQIGADAVEIYTGPFACAFDLQKPEHELAQCERLAATCGQLGLMLNAGHDLNQHNIPALQHATGGRIAEMSIGHALFGDAIYDGLAATVKRYLLAMRIDASA